MVYGTRSQQPLWEVRATSWSPSGGLPQTLADGVRLPADWIRTHLSPAPFPRRHTIFLPSMRHLMQGSGPACWLERAICIFYVTGNLCTSAGSCWKKQTALPHGGASETFSKGKEGGGVQRQTCSALLESLRRLPSPTSWRGLMGSCCLCPRDVIFCCRFRLVFCCPGAGEAV